MVLAEHYADVGRSAERDLAAKSGGDSRIRPSPDARLAQKTDRVILAVPADEAGARVNGDDLVAEASRRADAVADDKGRGRVPREVAELVAIGERWVSRERPLGPDDEAGTARRCLAGLRAEPVEHPPIARLRRGAHLARPDARLECRDSDRLVVITAGGHTEDAPSRERGQDTAAPAHGVPGRDGDWRSEDRAAVEERDNGHGDRVVDQDDEKIDPEDADRLEQPCLVV